MRRLKSFVGEHTLTFMGDPVAREAANDSSAEGTSDGWKYSTHREVSKLPSLTIPVYEYHSGFRNVTSPDGEQVKMICRRRRQSAPENSTKTRRKAGRPGGACW